jgi:PhzF family phenazine biosynthesis protein
VQECAAGLVTLRREPRLAFAAPPMVRSGEPTAEERAEVLAALALDDDDVVAIEWCDNGPGWIGVLLRSAEAVLAVRPDLTRFGDLDIGLVGPHADDRVQEVGALVEVRGLFRALGVVEDPVTGSLNASLAQWLTGNGTLPPSYVAAQGTLLGRSGRVHVERDGDTVWVGGETRTVVVGEVALGG